MEMFNRCFVEFYAGGLFSSIPFDNVAKGRIGQEFWKKAYPNVCVRLRMQKNCPEK